MRPALFLVCLSACVAEVGGPGDLGEVESEIGSCRKRVNVTFAVYSYFPRPTSNGCWNYERIVQNPEFTICGIDGIKRRPEGHGRWVYDDTAPMHDQSLERARIAECAAGRRDGYVLMARRGSRGWDRLDPTGTARRFYAEIYSSQYAVDDQFDEWWPNRAVGSPMINLSPADPSRVEASVRRVCRSVPNGGYLGIYFYDGTRPLDGAHLRALERGLDDCTRARSLATSAEPEENAADPGAVESPPVEPEPAPAPAEPAPPPPPVPPAPAPMCLPLHAACSAGACCGGLACAGGRCCQPVGASCGDRAECCDGRACVDGGCCVVVGDGCSSDGQCCGGRACSGGKCCVRVGQGCGRDEQCCSGRCTSGQCR